MEGDIDTSPHRWREAGGKEVRCDVTGVAVPSAAHSIEMDVGADAIFLVEKECIFRRLLDGAFQPADPAF